MQRKRGLPILRFNWHNDLLGVNFGSLVYRHEIFIDEVVLDKISVSIFKDQRKPIDKNHFPQYLGQQIKAIPIPLLVKHVKARM